MAYAGGILACACGALNEHLRPTYETRKAQASEEYIDCVALERSMRWHATTGLDKFGYSKWCSRFSESIEVVSMSLHVIIRGRSGNGRPSIRSLYLPDVTIAGATLLPPSGPTSMPG